MKSVYHSRKSLNSKYVRTFNGRSEVPFNFAFSYEVMKHKPVRFIINYSSKISINSGKTLLYISIDYIIKYNRKLPTRKSKALRQYEVNKTLSDIRAQKNRPKVDTVI